MSKVESLSLVKCKNIANFYNQLNKLKAKIVNLKILIKNYFVIKAINFLD